MFGPVLTLSKLTETEDAYAQVNSSRFGIHCGVSASSEAITERAFQELEVGGVIINDFPALRFENMPYGGVKRNGFGREDVRYAMSEMSVQKVKIERK